MWADLAWLLGYTGVPGLATQIHNSYNLAIRPHEQPRERARNPAALLPSKPRDPGLKTHTNIQTSTTLPQLSTAESAADDDSPPSSPLTATSSPLSEPPDESDMKETNGVKSDASRPRRSTRSSAQDLLPFASTFHILQCRDIIHAHS